MTMQYGSASVALLGALGLAAAAHCAATGMAPSSSAMTVTTTTAIAAEPPAPQGNDSVIFETAVLPILHTRCQPCHFEGGQMYDRLPFDHPATIVLLGEKLFTRIKNEDEQASIRAFLQGARTASVKQ